MNRGLKDEQQGLTVSRAVKSKVSVRRLTSAALWLGGGAQRSKIAHLSRPYFPHLYNGVINNNSSYLIVLFNFIIDNGKIYMRCLAKKVIY